jgi:Flp pilus assembly protein TadG
MAPVLRRTALSALIHGLGARWRPAGPGLPVRRACQAESGQALVGAALTFPLLLLVAVALVQLALYTHARNVVAAAVQDGALLAAAEDATLEEGWAHAQTLLEAGLGPSAARLRLALSETPGRELVVAEARGGLRLVFPWVSDVTLPLDARASARREDFRPGGG